jgi:cbb3-type cytochrome c oxidase subunit III
MKFVLLLMLLPVAFGIALANADNHNDAAGAANTKSGAELYTKNCASCHGRDGSRQTLKGKLKHARDLTDAGWQNRTTDERIFNSIMNGKGKMPAYGKKLSEADIDTLVSYVRALRK